MKQFLLAFALTAAATLAYAGAPDYAIHENYQSLRARGMGDAFDTIADDDFAMFYNPAALGRRHETNVHLFLQTSADSNVLPFYNDLKGAGSDPQSVDNVLNKYYGDDMYVRPTLGGIITRKHWSLAVLPVDFSNNFDLHHSVAASVYVNSTLDSTIAYAYGNEIHTKFLKNPLYWGFNLQFVHRAYYSDVIQSAQLATNNNLFDLSRMNEGATVDGDLGLLYKMQTSYDAKFKPSFSLVVRDIADEGFFIPLRFFNKNASAPPPYERVADAGSDVQLKRFWVFTPTVELDERDMGDSEWTPLKGLHLGADFSWQLYHWWKGFWNVGIDQGYWTAGFGASMSVFELELASWGEEIGTTSAPEESRRYGLELSLNF